MNPMLKVSAAVLIAAMSALPALAATTDVATVIVGTKADIVPIAKLDNMVGKWGKPELAALGKAWSVTVFDAGKLYSASDVKLLGAADTADMSALTKARASLSADAQLKAWFNKNKIDINHVVAISDTAGKVSIYTY
jgi:hypothetical protein